MTPQRLNVAMLVVALLVALGGWPAGIAYAQSTALSPHWNCYVITPKPSANEPVTLVDQFGTHDVVRRGAQFVCAPVSTKTIGGVTEVLTLPEAPFDHLKCHNITPSGPSLDQPATVTDQFGPEDVTLRTLQFICAPATKTIP